MKKAPPRLLLVLIALLVTTSYTNAVLSIVETVGLEDIEKGDDTDNTSNEIRSGFRLLKSGLNEQAFKEFNIAANRGELTAYMALGVMHRDGLGTPENLKLAKANFKKAYDKGNTAARDELVFLRFAAPETPEEFSTARTRLEKYARNGMAVAQLRLGMAHLTGYGYTADATKAINYLTQATESTGTSRSNAAFALGQLFRDGNLDPEVKPDSKRAETWLKIAAEGKHLGAIRALGEFYLSTDPNRQNFAAAKTWFSLLDQLGDPYALYYLGEMSESGSGCQKSQETALNYYQRAAKKEVPPAIYRLAYFHEHGLGGLKEDKDRAIDLYRQGAGLGHSVCMYNLSVMLDAMDDKPDIKAEVIPWLLRSASAGLADAEYSAGMRYHEGNGVQQDFIAAAAWFDRASRSGHSQAQLNLGVYYENGQGLVRDYRSARRLFELSAKGGNPAGQIKYAEALANGAGGKQDLPEAYFYAQTAAKAPDNPVAEIAIKLRDVLTRTMTPEQLAEGMRLLNEPASQATK
ncbi:tetratricopeptide repeat protein [Haloferula sp.]|uniref:tetratricopeptide repeat protein n=1 Tax=Haloferula sp. TaxID=2497595 RepID=UPI003C74C664